MTSHKRPGWNEYFMNMVHVAKSRSTCVRGAVGALIIKDRRIISTGYNDTPVGIANCGEGGCSRCKERHEARLDAGQEKDKCICVHAEQNAILQSAFHGVSTKGATLYSTVAPCISCAKLIINAGIAGVVIDENYSDEEGKKLLEQAGVMLSRSPVKKEV